MKPCLCAQEPHISSAWNLQFLPKLYHRCACLWHCLLEGPQPYAIDSLSPAWTLCSYIVASSPALSLTLSPFAPACGPWVDPGSRSYLCVAVSAALFLTVRLYPCVLGIFLRSGKEMLTRIYFTLAGSLNLIVLVLNTLRNLCSCGIWSD